VRQALTETSMMGDDIQQLSSFNGQINLPSLSGYFVFIKHSENAKILFSALSDLLCSLKTHGSIDFILR